MSVPEKDWRWFGQACHLIVGHECRFHMATVIGDYLISTVGDWRPNYQVIENHKKGLRGDAAVAAVEAEDIGYGRKYETMVFRVDGYCSRPDCKCGIPMTNGHNLDFGAYNDAQSATDGHLRLCRRWASGKPEEGDG